MRRYLLAASALAWAAFLAWGCASVHEAEKNRRMEYDLRGGLSAEEYWRQHEEPTRNGEACDEGLTEAEVDSIYSWGLTP